MNLFTQFDMHVFSLLVNCPEVMLPRMHFLKQVSANSWIANLAISMERWRRWHTYCAGRWIVVASLGQIGLVPAGLEGRGVRVLPVRY